MLQNLGHALPDGPLGWYADVLVNKGHTQYQLHLTSVEKYLLL